MLSSAGAPSPGVSGAGAGGAQASVADFGRGTTVAPSDARSSPSVCAVTGGLGAVGSPARTSAISTLADASAEGTSSSENCAAKVAFRPGLRPPLRPQRGQGGPGQGQGL